MNDDYKLPPGRQPYEQIVGLRVGALAGGLIGALATAVAGVRYAWLVLAFAVVGAAAGVWAQRRRDAKGDDRVAD